jgi:hypothetical protein
MALTALPLTDSFPLAWDHDPALDRARETFAHDFTVAVDTLDWDALAIPGQRPSLFWFRPLDGQTVIQLIDSGLKPLTQTVLVFRMALVRVENLDGAPPLERVIDPRYPEPRRRPPAQRAGAPARRPGLSALDGARPKIVEGLRALPWLQAARDEPGQHELLNCMTCRKNNDPNLRRAMGCGWLPPSATPAGFVWSGPGGHLDLATCPGYTTRLPDVLDVAGAYWWADRGALAERVGRRPPAALVRGIDALRCEISALEVHQIRKARDKR